MDMDKIEERNLTRRGAGRPKGAANKTTALLKEAIIRAAEATGEDMQGKGKLTGYCKFLAKTEPKAFAQLLGKVLPMQITGDGGGALQVVVKQFTLADN
jgi:hypothetical protein